jgi:hypothetical protein
MDGGAPLIGLPVTASSLQYLIRFPVLLVDLVKSDLFPLRDRRE